MIYPGAASIVRMEEIITMPRGMKAIDISGVPDLIRLAEEVRETGEPRVLRRANEDLAVLMPVPKTSRRREKTEADYEAFRSSAGSWKDVDTDKLIDDIYESRRRSSRPPVEL